MDDKGIQQGRTWAVLGPGGQIFHVVETGVPAVYSKRKEAENLKKRIDAVDLGRGSEVKIITKVIEVKIVEVNK